MSVITKILPKRRLSRLVGKIVHWEGPKWWAHWSIKTFANFYKISLPDAEKPYTDYPSIGEFFVRKLKAGIRPVATSWAVHCADSRITQCEAIAGGKMIQAKGFTYTAEEFTQDKNALQKWEGGVFMTYYLCPTDYHRVHSPVSGTITDVRYMPGKLWPVNQWSTSNIENLFSINERMLVEIETDLGPVAVVLVGATNVGHICLSFDDHFHGNQKSAHIFEHKRYSPGISIKAGDEIGMFRMGSTAVILFPPLFREKFADQLDQGPLVKVNSALTPGKSIQ